MFNLPPLASRFYQPVILSQTLCIIQRQGTERIFSQCPKKGPQASNMTVDETGDTCHGSPGFFLSIFSTHADSSHQRAEGHSACSPARLGNKGIITLVRICLVYYDHHLPQLSFVPAPAVTTRSSS